LFSNTLGYTNAALGSGSMYANTIGKENTSLGTNSLSNSTSGDGNVAIGYDAGSYRQGGLNLAGNNNIYIGKNSKSSNSNRNEEIVIGYNQVGIGDSSFVIGGLSNKKGQLVGKIGIGTNNPLYDLHIEGSTYTNGQADVVKLRVLGNAFDTLNALEVINSGTGSTRAKITQSGRGYFEGLNVKYGLGLHKDSSYDYGDFGNVLISGGGSSGLTDPQWMVPNNNQYSDSSLVKILTNDSIKYYDTYYLHAFQTSSDTLKIPLPKAEQKGKKIQVTTYDLYSVGSTPELNILVSQAGSDYFIHEGNVSDFIKIGSQHGHWQVTLLCMQVSASDYKWVTISQ
jgi:hypothetical protein